MNETAGWFEIIDKKLLVWEGVCALSSSDSVVLLKVVQDENIGSIRLPFGNLEVASEGYWNCVELTGSLSNGSTLYYHADTSKKAKKILSLLNKISPILSLSLRLDDDPLRLEDLETNRARLLDWISLLTRFHPKPTRFSLRDFVYWGPDDELEP